MERYRFSEEERSMLEKLRIPLAVYQTVDRRAEILLLSDGFLEMFEYDDREAALNDMRQDIYLHVHPDDSARISEAALRFASSEDPDEKYEVIYRSRKRKDQVYHIIHAVGEHLQR